MERVLVSIRDAGGMLGLGRSSIYRMIGEDRLETVKFGNRRLVKVASIAAIAETGFSRSGQK